MEGKFITGFYFEKVNELFNKPQPWDVKRYIATVRLGIEHLHSLGLCHNDVCPFNIMLTDDDTAILIDLDACVPIGEKLHKFGNRPFLLEGTKISACENDWYGLKKTEEYMYERLRMSEEESEGSE